MESNERAYVVRYTTQDKTYKYPTNCVESLVKEKLDQEGFEKNHEYILVSSRLKKADSFLKKMQKVEAGERKYENPIEITDIAGIRIVGCTLSDIQELWLSVTLK